MNVGDICTREVVLADRGASLQQAASLMRGHHVGLLVVTQASEGGLQLAGLVTDRDIVVEAVSVMKSRGVRRLLVSGDEGKLYGVVSLDDVLGALGHEMAELAHAVRRGIDRESAERPPLTPAPATQRPLHIPAYAFA